MNVILHTTASINHRKQSLLVSHALYSVLNVFIIIVLELFLAVISFPLYLVSRESNIGSATQYKLRRIVSLSILVVLLAIWLIKLFFIIGIPMFFRTDLRYSVREKESAIQEFSEKYVLSDVLNAKIDSAYVYPTLDTLDRSNGYVSANGSAQLNSDVIVSVSRKGSDASPIGTNYYATSVDPFGNWSIILGKEGFYLMPGMYQMQMMAYSRETDTKSELSPVASFQVSRPWYGWILDNIDLYLDYLVIIFVIVGISSVLLLI